MKLEPSRRRSASTTTSAAGRGRPERARGRRRAPLAFAPLVEGVLDRVGHAVSSLRLSSSVASPASSPARLMTMRSGSIVTVTGPVARPVLRVGGVVLHRGVEPEPVALLAVVERALERPSACECGCDRGRRAVRGARGGGASAVVVAVVASSPSSASSPPPCVLVRVRPPPRPGARPRAPRPRARRPRRAGPARPPRRPGRRSRPRRPRPARARARA